MDQSTRLSDVDLAVDGTTQSEIIANRMARDELITRAAKKGDKVCAAADELAALARSMGCYGGSVWDEDLDEESDMGGMW